MRIRIRIRAGQKHADPADPDPKAKKQPTVALGIVCIEEQLLHQPLHDVRGEEGAHAVLKRDNNFFFTFLMCYHLSSHISKTFHAFSNRLYGSLSRKKPVS